MIQSWAEFVGYRHLLLSSRSKRKGSLKSHECTSLLCHSFLSQVFCHFVFSLPYLCSSFPFSPLLQCLYRFIIFLPHSFTIPLSLQSIRLHNHTLRCILTYLSPAQSHLLSQEHEVLMHEPEIKSLSTAASSYNSRNIVALSFLRYSYVPAESFFRACNT